jgi:secreted PhoX family phosphatase
MLLSRRHLIRSAASVALAAPALQLIGCATPGATRPQVSQRVSGLALVPDPAGVIDLAPGLSYVVLSRVGEEMSDGLLEPGAHDGMAAFPVEGDPSRCLLVRNHELGASSAASAFGADYARVQRIASDRVYDLSPGGKPFAGGTTTALFNLSTMRAERTHLSLAGTAVNCAGGSTPWGSWLSCEETQIVRGAEASQPHGFIFEVPASATGPVSPVPLKAMGRFSHEAAAVDPATGIVYLTEDTGDSLFYRFLPASRGELAKGGRLQALALVEQAGADTRNWAADKGGDPALRILQGRKYAVRWIDMEDVEAPGGDLRLRGRAAGAAVFARGEGMAFALEAGGPAVYFACTSGGAAQIGQIFRYVPSLFEGGSRESEAPAELELFVESTGEQEFEKCDNIVASPRGELIVCEDGDADNFIRAITPDGLIYTLARSAGPEKSELCGACFSPDGSTLFVNIQRPGITIAITGAWDALRTQAVRLA